MKFVLLALILAVAAFIFFGLGRRRRKPPAHRSAAQGSRPGPSGAASAPSAPASPSPAPMVACSHCGVHLPSADAVTVAQRSFCSAAHRDAALAAEAPRDRGR